MRLTADFCSGVELFWTMAVQNGNLLTVALCLGLLGHVYGTRIKCESLEPAAKTVYDFNATNIYKNETISFSQYRGNVLAIVNVVGTTFI